MSEGGDAAYAALLHSATTSSHSHAPVSPESSAALSPGLPSESTGQPGSALLAGGFGAALAMSTPGAPATVRSVPETPGSAVPDSTLDYSYLSELDFPTPVAASGRERTAAIVDEDLERVSIEFDRWNQVFQKEMMSVFVDIKRSMISRYQRAMEREQRNTVETLAVTEADLNATQAQLVETQTEVTQRQLLVERLAGALGEAAVKRRADALSRSVLLAWLSQTPARRRAMWARRQAAMFADRRVMRTVFRAWHREARTGRMNAIDKFWQDKLKQTTEEVMSGYESTVFQMTEQLVSTQEQMKKEVATKMKLEEELKKSFMRGVCALNLEAMALLRKGGIPALQLTQEQTIEHAARVWDTTHSPSQQRAAVVPDSDDHDDPAEASDVFPSAVESELLQQLRTANTSAISTGSSVLGKPRRAKPR